MNENIINELNAIASRIEILENMLENFIYIKQTTEMQPHHKERMTNALLEETTVVITEQRMKLDNTIKALKNEQK